MSIADRGFGKGADERAWERKVTSFAFMFVDVACNLLISIKCHAFSVA